MKNLIKGYFLAFAGAQVVPFLNGGLVGMMLGTIVVLGVFVVRRLYYPGLSFEPWPLAIPGLMLASGILHEAICSLFISHKWVGLYLMVKDGQVIVAGNPLWTGLRWLWSRRGIRVLWISLPSVEETHTVNLDIANTAFAVGLVVSFTGAFDPQEVYEKFAQRYTHFDYWLRDKFLSVVTSSADVLRVLEGDRPPAERLPELVVALDRALAQEGGFSTNLLSNIRPPIKVVVSASAEILA